MAEAAQGTAADIEGRAREARDTARGEALQSARRVADEIARLERELSQLQRFVAKEADGLRATVDRSQLNHGPARAADVVEALAGPAAPEQRGALAPAAVEEAPEVRVVERAEEVGQGAAPTEEAPMAKESPPEAGAESDTTRVRVPPDETAADAAGPTEPPAGEPGSLESRDLGTLHQNVEEASDLELAEIYLAANEKVDGASDEAQLVYWTTVVRAAVDEAVARPGFGEAPSEQTTSRKVKKRRARALKPLVEAREAALQGGPQTQAADGGDRAIATEAEAEAEEAVAAHAPPAPEAPQGAAEAAPEGAQDVAEPAPEPDATDVEPAADEATTKGGRRRSRRRAGRRRNRPFIDTPGHCAVCGQELMAGDEETLAESGWLVNDQVGLCPEDQAQGWELPPGRPVPYRRGAGD